MNHGIIPDKPDHRDYDFVASFGAPVAPKFPPELNVDAGLWVPDQNLPEPLFKNPPLPYGCTSYTQADLCADDDAKLYNPMDLENITHANDRGGISIREALDTARKVYNRTYYFSVNAKGGLDFFDAIRFAMMAGAPEKRSVSIGTPWFPSWEVALQQKTGVVPMPSEAERSVIHRDPAAIPWHNHKICGWKQINGTPHLISKSWQGKEIGDGGFAYFPREVINTVMAIPGTCAFTLTNMGSDSIQTIDLPFLKLVMSFIRNFFGLSY